jgi:hypothetical protein
VLTGTPTRTTKRRPQRSLRTYTQLILHSPRSLGQSDFQRSTFISTGLDSSPPLAMAFTLGMDFL